MEQRVKVTFGSAVIVLAVGAAGGLIASTVVASKAYRSQWEHKERSEQTMTATGSARRRIRSDLAMWTIRIKGEGVVLPEAFQRLKSGVGQLLSFLESHGFSPGEIAREAIETDTHYAKDKDGHDTRDVVGYTLSQDFNVSSPQVDAVSAASGEVTGLIESGVLVVSYRPRFHYTQIASLKIEMIGEASRDARKRADQVAENAGCAVADVRTARVGVLQITEPNSTAVSGEGIHDTSTIEKDVTSVVTLTLGIRSR